MNILQEIKVPQESVNDLSVTVMEVHVQNGLPVTAGTVLFELESSKATFTVSADVDGFVEILTVPGDEVTVGQTIARITNIPVISKEQQTQPLQPISTNATLVAEQTIFSVKAKTLLQQYHLTEDDFAGKDFVSVEDVKIKAGIVTKVTAPIPENKPKTEAIQVPLKHHIYRIPVSKKREIAYLNHVQSAGLNSQVTTSLDVAGLFRSVNKQMVYFKNSLLPLVIYECARLLLKYPELNAFFDNDTICYYDEINIGIAMDIDDGLKTVSLVQADTMDMRLLEENMMNLSEKYLAKTLTGAELSGITFTITDLSAEDVLIFTPLINRQNAAILGISSIQQDNRCNLTMSFDHRITVGKRVAQFMHELKDRLESYRGQTEDVSSVACYKCLKNIKEDFSGIGFSKVITPKGAEAYICQTCLKGF